MIWRGQYSQRFWAGVVGVGHVLPVVLLVAIALGLAPVAAIVAGACALLGLLLFEDIWVRAGQALPLS